MKFDRTICIFGILGLMLKSIEGTILCSVCRSDQMEDCEQHPPEPQPCPEMHTALVKSCTVVRIINKTSGDLSMFIRSCAASTSYDGCADTQPGFQTCATVCYTDGCNTSSSLHSRGGTMFQCLLLTILATVLLCARWH